MTGWALALGIAGFVIALTSLAFSFMSFRANGPVLKASISSALMFGDGDPYSALVIDVVNAGRASATVRRVWLTSSTSTAATGLDDVFVRKQPARPVEVGPTGQVSWILDYQRVKEHLLSRFPGDVHLMQVRVQYGTRVAKSRSRQRIGAGPEPSHRTLRQRVKERLLSARVQAVLSQEQPRLFEGLQRLDLVNYGTGFVRDIRVDLLAYRDGSGFQRVVVEEAGEVRVPWMGPKQTRHIHVPYDITPPAPGDELFWRIRSRNLLGRHIEIGHGFHDTSDLAMFLELQRKHAPWPKGDRQPGGPPLT